MQDNTAVVKPEDNVSAVGNSSQDKVFSAVNMAVVKPEANVGNSSQDTVSSCDITLGSNLKEKVSGLQTSDQEALSLCETTGEVESEDKVSGLISGLQARVSTWYGLNKSCLALLAVVEFFMAVSAYLSYCMYRDLQGSVPLIVFAAIFVTFASLYLVHSKWGDIIQDKYVPSLRERAARIWKHGQWVWFAGLVVGFAVYLAVEIRHTPHNFVALSGIAFFILVSFIFSTNPSQVPWRVVASGLAIQMVMGIIILRWSAGANAISWLAQQLTTFINYGLVGAKFVFGESYTDHYFAMSLMPILCYFVAVTNVLYYWGIVQFFIRTVGGFVQFIMGTSTVEAFVAVANIFFGPEASVMMVSSTVSRMSYSQLHTIMACGLATIDGGLIAVFDNIGVPGRHLVTATFMSAPAALAYSKMLCPEKKDGQGERVEDTKLKFEKSTSQSALGAFSDGAVSAVPIIAGVLAILVAFLSILAFLNTTLTWLGHRAGYEDNLTIELICSYLFLPMAYLMGVEWADCHEVAKLMGIKTIVNEFVAYSKLSVLISNREQGLEPAISERSEAISTYALCGFSNIGTMGFMIGFLTVLAPNKKAEIASVAVRSLVASSIACFSTAAVAALLYMD